jgi:hypothetical protein
VPKGIPLEPGARRLAVHVEDHPLDYATFEGEIPAGQYGAGLVEIWDDGTYELVEEKRDGGLTVRLHGKRLDGTWALVPAKLDGDPKNWLIIRKRDEAAAAGTKHREYAPMLATLVEDVPSGDEWVFEVKWDGYRALAYVRGSETKLVSRNGNDLTARFGSVATAISRATKSPDCVLDGEVCALDEQGRASFSAMQQGEAGTPYVYYAFDLLELEGEPLVDLPLLERRRRLEQILDRRGRTVVAYALRLSSRKTFLRLVRGGTNLRPQRVTRAGFPFSDVAPSAAPVLMPSGAIRVVETYGQRSSGAIEWAPRRRDWVGQYIFASALGTPVGLVRAVATGGSLYSAWTQVYPGLGESHVLLTRHFLGRHDPQEETATVLPHAALVDLASTPEGIELAANDWTTLGDTTIEAAMLAFPDAPPVELDGTLLGYAAGRDGSRGLLLASGGELSWFRAPVRPSVRVTLAASSAAAGPLLSGRVAGASAGTVELYAEDASGRRLVAEPAVGPDGSFSASPPRPASATLYRAVYRDPGTGLPYASLLRTPVG